MNRIQPFVIGSGKKVLTSGKLTGGPIVVNSGAKLCIEDVEIRFGQDAALELRNNSRLIIRNAVFVVDEDFQGGSLINTYSGSTVKIQNLAVQGSDKASAITAFKSNVRIINAVFENCCSDEPGGAIYAKDTELKIALGKFISCKSKRSGGAILFFQDTGASLDVEACEFDNCTSAIKGGAISSNYEIKLLKRTKGALRVRHSLFKKCTAGSDGGGGIYFQYDIPCDDERLVEGCWFEDCQTRGPGGGIFDVYENTKIINCAFTNCIPNGSENKKAWNPGIGQLKRRPAITVDPKRCDWIKTGCEDGFYERQYIWPDEYSDLEICPACGAPIRVEYVTENGETVCSELCLEIEKRCKPFQSSAVSALAYGNAQTAQIYSEQVVFGAERGHGFAAEQALDIHDKFHGRNARIVGGDNQPDGPDRLVNGEYLQTKYCKTGSKCIEECFRDKFRYYRDGTPMAIEVPADKYEDAVRAMENRIKTGQIPGVTDPKQARQLVRAGEFTYDQVRNIAKFGTVESLAYDAARGIVVSRDVFGISFVLTFAAGVWKGKKVMECTQDAFCAGMKVGGVSWLTHLASSQLGRTAVESSLRGTTDFLTKSVGSKGAAYIAKGLTGKTLSGAAAMNSASKLLRGNLVTAAVTTTILSGFDIGRFIQGKISGSQAFRNIATTAASVVGGTGGWTAGAAAGAALGSFIPLVGTAAGALIGGLSGAFIGSNVGSDVANGVLGKFIEDDAVEMLKIIESTLTRLAVAFLLSEKEVEKVISRIQQLDMASELRNLYAVSYRAGYAALLLKPLVLEVVKERPTVSMPQETLFIQQVAECVEALVEAAPAAELQ